ncbi:hypothetical protein A6E01_20390 (plasmid) [Vibrio breoganii]|uniref:Uncharacterized protein n=1 Tax=Vibrio breoganii TaxID=553239 RepID=A0AAN0Y074_9VIBR|nr:hypothetical protein [Vibrio breoganii]ANO35574.1 hypothetical protein A6E01_20390 [Vibrio breoganii]PML15836.1 hypothetical protein BCT84_07485 [Vibrio breoganii]
MKRDKSLFELDTFYINDFNVDNILTNILVAHKDQKIRHNAPIIIDVSNVLDPTPAFNVLSLKIQLKKHSILLAAITGTNDIGLIGRAIKSGVSFIPKAPTDH